MGETAQETQRRIRIGATVEQRQRNRAAFSPHVDAQRGAFEPQVKQIQHVAPKQQLVGEGITSDFDGRQYLPSNAQVDFIDIDLAAILPWVAQDGWTRNWCCDFFQQRQRCNREVRAAVDNCRQRRAPVIGGGRR